MATRIATGIFRLPLGSGVGRQSILQFNDAAIAVYDDLLSGSDRPRRILCLHNRRNPGASVRPRNPARDGKTVHPGATM